MHESSEQRHLVNRTYDEIRVGDYASLVRTLMPEDVKLFAVLTGDFNPSHADPSYSESGMFREVIAHGMWSGSLISTVLGTQFPGPGTILVDQTLHFARPVTIGDTITVSITAKQKFDHNKHVVFDCVCTNQEGLQVVRGTAEVLAPSEKISRLQDVHMPEVSVDDKHERYTRLLSRVKGLEPIPTAVAHPCDRESLKGPVIAFQEGIIEPILVGPESKIRVQSPKSSASTCTASASSMPATATTRPPSPSRWCGPAMPKP
jgi:phosphate acetyltransferase